MKAFVFDLNKCVGCHNCQIVCKDEHCDNDWTPIAKPQPETGQFWCKVNQFERGTLPKIKVAYIPVICQHCQDAPCQKVCKIEGAIYRRKDGLVIIDPLKCKGCQECVGACPYGAVYFNNQLNIAQKCTGCAHLLDRGWKEPRCVDACPTNAISWVEEGALKNFSAKTEVLHPEYHTQPNVLYIDLPRKFVAGTVYDPIKEEIIEGAVCTLTGGGKTLTTSTDGFGDFWFEGLDIGRYALNINYRELNRNFDAVDTSQDVNLGDIPIS
jgi:tetrathionate reductase subunit B